MKRILLCLILLTGGVATIAAADFDCLLVHFASGSKAVFPLANHPRITFDGGVAVFAMERYSVANVRKYTFANSASTGIIPLGGNNAVGNVRRDGSLVYVRPNEAGVSVRLYTTDGVEVRGSVKTGADGLQIVDLGNLTTGIYLLSVGSETIKLTKP